jgi:hypothetical protein
MPTCALARRKIVVESRRRCSGRLWIVGFWKARESAIFGLFKWIGINEELCNRVLTTSRGHVTTAPAVPATLQLKNLKKINLEFC